MPLAFPLGPEAGLSIAFRILKCALIPFVPDRLKAADIDPFSALPPSSPVLKHGFEPDARSAWKMLAAHADLFFDKDDRKRQSGHIKDLTRIRDRWAHQQELKPADFQRVCDLGQKLLGALDRGPEALALRLLAKPFDTSLHDQFVWAIESSQLSLPAPADTLLSLLNLDETLEGYARANRLLVHEAASACLAGQRPMALAFTTGNADEPADLPPGFLWWVIGLSHDAPEAEKRAAWKSAYSELAGSGASSY